MSTNTTERLSDTEVADLVAALDDEYMARATYAQVIADFGAVRPFINIVDSEGRHAEALISLFQDYGVPVPADTWPGRVARYTSLSEACKAAVAAEVENAELYDRLLAGTDKADILDVYRNLQEASQERHLSAFRRCVERGGSTTGEATGDGRGRRRRRRRQHGQG
jgi:hypothetical protein